MKNKLQQHLLSHMLDCIGHADITVHGISMNPTLFENDIVTISSREAYDIGDILVFNYKDEGLLLHRLLHKEGRYFCKGDNAFRLEDISPTDVFGKVIAVNGRIPKPWPEWKIQLSLAINRKFRSCNYNKEATKQTDIYQIYSSLVLGEKDTPVN